jgi:NAD(P)-dependent dehydrogenase (short-subunit alcohol dehydrogenase family)
MLMDETLSERRVCLITGAGGRLGADFCSRFADAYHIVAVCRHRFPDVRTQNQWHIDPTQFPPEPLPEPTVFAIEADLTHEGAVDRIIELTLARFGRIDLLVNAAVFVQRERLTTLADTTAFLDQAFQVNATVPIRLAAAIARAFWCDAAASNRKFNRNVVNISSGAGLGFVSIPGLSAYSASKVALNFLTCYLAEEFRGIGVRVNAIAPTTFPDLIPTSTVSEQIVRVDGADYSGQIVELLE